MSRKKVKWLKVKEAATMLGISESTVYRYYKEGILEGQKTVIGSRIRISRKCVEDLLRELEA